MTIEAKDVINKLETLYSMECQSLVDQQWHFLVACLWDQAIVIKCENEDNNGVPYGFNESYLGKLEEFSKFMVKIKELTDNIYLMSIQLEKMGDGTLPTESQVRDLKETCQAACRCLE